MVHRGGVPWRWLRSRKAAVILMGLGARLWNGALNAAPIRLWALLLWSPVVTGLDAWIIYMVRNGWPPEAAHQQLNILGNALYIHATLLGVIIVTLAAIHVSARGWGGSGIDIDGSGGDSKKAVVTATIESHVETTKGADNGNPKPAVG